MTRMGPSLQIFPPLDLGTEEFNWDLLLLGQRFLPTPFEMGREIKKKILSNFWFRFWFIIIYRCSLEIEYKKAKACKNVDFSTNPSLNFKIFSEYQLYIVPRHLKNSQKLLRTFFDFKTNLKWCVPSQLPKDHH